MADLARRFQLFQRAHRLGERGVVVWPVDQQQVDPVGIQALEAAFGSGQRPFTRRVPRGGAVDFEAHLGHQDDLLAPGAQRAAQDLFRVVGAVGFCSVEQRDTVVDRGADGRAGLIYIDVAVFGRAHLPRAEPQRRTDQIGVAKSPLLHHIRPVLVRDSGAYASRAFTGEAGLSTGRQRIFAPQPRLRLHPLAKAQGALPASPVSRIVLAYSSSIYHKWISRQSLLVSTASSDWPLTLALKIAGQWVKNNSITGASSIIIAWILL